MKTEEIFINSINVKEVRNIKDLDIPLDRLERKHLIFTGKNGSGKTTLLLELKKFLENVFNGQYQEREQQKSNLDHFKSEVTSLINSVPENDSRLVKFHQNIDSINNWLERFGGIDIEFTNDHKITNATKKGTFLIAYFDAKRKASLQIPSGITKVPH